MAIPGNSLLQGKQWVCDSLLVLKVSLFSKYTVAFVSRAEDYAENMLCVRTDYRNVELVTTEKFERKKMKNKFPYTMPHLQDKCRMHILFD